MFYEEFVRFVCEKSDIDVLMVTSLTPTYISTIALKCPNEQFMIEGFGLSAENSEVDAWKNCFRNTKFRYYVNLLSITGELDNMNMNDLC